MNGWVATIGSVFAFILVVWKYFSRKNRAKRQLAEDAGKDLDNAHKNKSKSDLLDAWDKSGRL